MFDLAIEACEWALSLDSEHCGVGSYAEIPNAVHQAEIAKYRQEIKDRFGK